DSHDRNLFSAFLTREIEALKVWYTENAGKVTKGAKADRLQRIHERFVTEIKPRLKTTNYSEFEKRELNNAFLLAYQTYEYSLDDFAKLFSRFNHDFKKTLEYLRSLDGEENPAQKLKEFVSGGSTSATSATSTEAARAPWILLRRRTRLSGGGPSPAGSHSRIHCFNIRKFSKASRSS
ncbi:MAG: aminopeptidase, partial [Bdellovibrionales bacterium]